MHAGPRERGNRRYYRAHYERVLKQDDLPRRRGKVAAGPLRHYLTSLAALSASLHGARPDHGEDPALLGRADIEGRPRLTRCFARHVARAFSETETRQDVWDLAVFGQPGRLIFTKISQRWLREAAKRSRPAIPSGLGQEGRLDQSSQPGCRGIDARPGTEHMRATGPARRLAAGQHPRRGRRATDHGRPAERAACHR